MIGRLLVEVGESTVGCAWLFVWLMNMMWMFAAGKVLTMKRHRRNASKRISSANGQWMTAIHPKWWKDKGTWLRTKVAPQVVGC